LGEFSSESTGHGDGGDHQENGLEDRDQIAGTIKASPGKLGDFYDKDPTGPEKSLKRKNAK
jgi:hypothetical protein